VLCAIVLFPLWCVIAATGSGRDAGVAAATAFLSISIARTLDTLPNPSFIAVWNVSGKLAEATAALAAIAWIGRCDWRAFGLHLDLGNPRVRRAFVGVTTVLGGLFAVAIGLRAVGVLPPDFFGHNEPRAPLWETLLFQFVIVAVAEELTFRGFLQSYLDKVLPARRHVAGAGLGWSFVVSVLTFQLVHSLGVSVSPFQLTLEARLDVLPAALGFAWLRAYAGSVWPAVLAHGLGNGLGVLQRLLAPRI